MKTITETSTTNSAFGTPLPEPVTYEYTFRVYETDAEFEAAQAHLSIEEQRKVRDNEAQSNARSKKYNTTMLALGYVKPDINNNDQKRLREFHKVLMSSKKYDDATARAMAEDQLGVKWAE